MKKSILFSSLAVIGVTAAFTMAVQANQPHHILNIGPAEGQPGTTRLCHYSERNGSEVIGAHDIKNSQMSLHYNSFQRNVLQQPAIIELTPELKQQVAGHCPSIQ